MANVMIRTFLFGALAASLVGCNLTGATDAAPAFPSGQAEGARASTAFAPPSTAGLEVKQDADATKMAKLVAKEQSVGTFGSARSDPFALTSAERNFETTQEAERVFAGPSGFTVELTPKPQVEDEAVAPEPQPYRRLSGIVVGDSILAILEEEGKQPVIVTPGMKIPDSEWRVISIDQEKAVLRRSGKARPSQVIVRLEVPRPGTAAASGQTGGFPGAPGGGYPGAPGGGYPGMPGGRGGKGGDDGA